MRAFGGAKNHAVIMPDADPAFVANALAGAAYGSAGERCMALTVAVLVGDAIADTLIQHLQQEIQKIKVGPGLEPGMDMGPLITAEHRAKVVQYIESGVAEGAKLIVDGRTTSFAAGNFLAPAFLTRCSPR